MMYKPKRQNKAWTPAEDAFLRKWAGKYSMRVLGEYLGDRTKNMVIGRCHRLGIHVGSRHSHIIKKMAMRKK